MSGSRLYFYGSLALLTALFFTASGGRALADPSPVVATIDVQGRADAQVPPDRATIEAQIITTADDAGTSARANDAVQARLVAAVAELHVPADALRVMNYESAYIAPSKDPAMPVSRHGFVVTRTVSLRVDPGSVDRATRALTGAGVDTVDQVTYDVVDTQAAARRMLTLAIRDAQEQARTIAAAAHVRIVRVSHINVNTPVFAAPQMRVMDSVAASPKAADMQLSATVSVTYDIAAMP